MGSTHTNFLPWKHVFGYMYLRSSYLTILWYTCEKLSCMWTDITLLWISESLTNICTSDCCRHQKWAYIWAWIWPSIPLPCSHTSLKVPQQSNEVKCWWEIQTWWRPQAGYKDSTEDVIVCVHARTSVMTHCRTGVCITVRGLRFVYTGICVHFMAWWDVTHITG